jgi:uroporphyrinogen-III decarboxylase
LGIKIKTLKDESSMPMWLEYPVTDNISWEIIKEEKLSLDNVKKRFEGSIDKFVKILKKEQLPIYLGDFQGFFGGLRFLMGETKLFMTYYDNPSLIKDINQHLLNLWLAISEELVSKIDFDAAFFWEDMSGKNGSLISPSTFKEFMTPYYKKITGFLKSKGINEIAVDTDGNVKELIPLFLEAGINMMFPFEQQAGNDLVYYRKKYPKLVMMGGFNKNTLSRGKEDIDKELEKMEWLIKRGGYIPFCDHAVPPNASWKNFKYYRQRLNKIIDSTKVEPTN